MITSVATKGLNNRMLREANGITLRELASKADVSISLISKFECGKVETQLVNIKRIDLALHDILKEREVSHMVTRGEVQKSLREFCRREKLTRKDISELTGCSDTTLFYNGKPNAVLTEETIKKICDGLGWDEYQLTHAGMKNPDDVYASNGETLKLMGEISELKIPEVSERSVCCEDYKLAEYESCEVKLLNCEMVNGLFKCKISKTTVEETVLTKEELVKVLSQSK